MANLSFMSELTEEQRQYAEIIRAKAQEMGIPPELAVAVAYQESRLNPQSASSSAGATGIMQVRPIAARDVGVDPTKLQDPTVNIDAGLRYLKKALNETGDPRLAVIYYNAGPQGLAEFDRGGDLPKQTENYLRSLKAYGAFNAPEPAQQASQAAPAETAAPTSSLGADLADIQRRSQEGANAQERRMAELAGLSAGAGVSALRAAPGSIRATRQALGQGAAAAAPVAAGAPGMPPAGPGAAGAPPALPTAGAAPVGAPSGPAAPAGPTPSGPRQLGVPGTYPVASGPGSATANYGRAFGLPQIEAERALGLGKAENEVWDLLNKRQEALTTIRQRFPSETYAENPRFGGIMTPVEGVGSGPRQSFVAAHPEVDPQAPPPKGPPPLQAIPPRTPVPMVPPKPSGLEQITQMFSQAARSGLEAIKPALAFGQRYVVPPLALAQGAGELVSAKQAMDQGDPLGATLRGLGGVGSVASMATPAALPVAIGAPLAQAFRERMAENAKRFPADTRPLTPEEEEMASRPAFFYRTFGRRPAMRR